MVRIALCDDNNLEREILKNIIEGVFNDMEDDGTIFEFSSGEKLCRNYSKGDYDIIFLDIHMKQLDGIETGKTIRNKDAKVEIVYATSSEEFLKEGYSVHALSYITKPYDVKKVRETIEYYYKKNGIEKAGKNELLEITIQQKKIYLRQKNIKWLESMGRIVNIHCNDDTYKVYARLTDIESKLDEKRFLRCYQSYIVNIMCVRDIDEYDFCLDEDKYIPIRKRDKKDIVQKYYNKRSAISRVE